MTKKLISIFVKDNQDVKNPKVRENYGKMVGIVGIISNLLLFALKFAVGIIFMSVSVVADAINNLSDGASCVITLIGFKLSGKPADQKHPFGHARFEYLAGLLVSFIIIIIGFELGQTSLDKIINPQEPVFDTLVFVVLGVSILVKLWQSNFYKKIGKQINSKTIFAISADSLNDVFATSAVFIAAIITKFTAVNLDGYMGIAVAVFIIYSGICAIIDTGAPLLGEAPDQELRDKISTKISGYENILGMHDLVVHNYGAGICYASVHCEVSASSDIMESHDLIDNIERDFKQNLGIDLVIHMDPIVTDDEKTNELKAKVKALVQAVFPQSTIHDFRVVWSVSHSNILFDINMPFTVEKSDKEIKNIVEKLVQTIDSDYRIIINVDRF